MGRILVTAGGGSVSWRGRGAAGLGGDSAICCSGAARWWQGILEGWLGTPINHGKVPTCRPPQGHSRFSGVHNKHTNL